MEAEYRFVAEELGKLGILYLHLVDPGATRGAADLTGVTRTMRRAFPGAVILCGGYDAARAEADVAAGHADLIAAARPFLANPDLPERWKHGLALNTPDRATFYTDGEKGYTDYPAAT
jgi:N-ethylmaleimide reductase